MVASAYVIQSDIALIYECDDLLGNLGRAKCLATSLLNRIIDTKRIK